jgi:hypothetical protein
VSAGRTSEGVPFNASMPHTVALLGRTSVKRISALHAKHFISARPHDGQKKYSHGDGVPVARMAKQVISWYDSEIHANKVLLTR